MSIDRIGKGPGATPTSPTNGVASASSKQTFSVGEAPVTTATSGASGVAGSSPAEQVRRGEMSMESYLDLRVNEATRHLEGKLGAGDLARVQEMLRSQIANDPLIQEMVKAATGKLPPAGE